MCHQGCFGDRHRSAKDLWLNYCWPWWRRRQGRRSSSGAQWSLGILSCSVWVCWISRDIFEEIWGKEQYIYIHIYIMLIYIYIYIFQWEGYKNVREQKVPVSSLRMDEEGWNCGRCTSSLTLLLIKQESNFLYSSSPGQRSYLQGTEESIQQLEPIFPGGNTQIPISKQTFLAR